MRVLKSTAVGRAMALAGLAAGVMIGVAGQANAADLPYTPAPGAHQQVVVGSCSGREVVILFDERGHPTIPARTPYYYCAVGTTLLAGDIPPPREYCCS